MTWWGILVFCPQCKKQASLQTVCHSADGEFLFTCYCFDCKAVVTWQTFASQLQHQALLQDLKKVAKPEVLKPPVVEDHKRDDDDWLHGMGIESIQ